MLDELEQAAQNISDRGLAALAKVLGGAERSGQLDKDLLSLESFLGTRRQLQTYAPRTRRRYVAAAKRKDKGLQGSRSRERNQRSSVTKSKYGVTPRQLTKLNKVLKPVAYNMEGEVREMLDPSVIKDMVKMYGFDYILTVLTEQLESIEAYKLGSIQPGRDRWNKRGTLEENAKKGTSNFQEVFYPKGTDPYYYYHSARR